MKKYFEGKEVEELPRIIFTKQVVFRDRNRTVLKVYEIGDTVEYTAKTDTYYITSMGGIWFEEAQEMQTNTQGI